MSDLSHKAQERGLTPESLEHIKEGLRQADAGEFASDDEVAAAFSKWRR